MADIVQSKISYKLRESYHQGWSYAESKQFSRRISLLSQRELFPYIPSRQKSKVLFYRLKYTTAVKFQHLFESFLASAKKFLKWRDEDVLERNFTRLIEKPGKISEVEALPSRQKQEVMNIIDQLRDKREEVMLVESNIPLEFGEDMQVNDFGEEMRGEEELQLSDSELEPLPPAKAKAPEVPRKAGEEEKERGAKSSEVRKTLEEHMLPEKKEVKDKNFNWFKDIVERNYPPKLDNVEIIYRILKLITSTSKNETIQEDIIGLTGYLQLDMLTQLFDHRSDIKSYMKNAFKGIKGLDKKNPSVDDIIVILQILGLELGDIQAKYPKHHKLMAEQTVSTTICGSSGVRQEQKDFTTIKFKAAPKDPHSEVPRIPLSVFPPWSQVMRRASVESVHGHEGAQSHTEFGVRDHFPHAQEHADLRPHRSGQNQHRAHGRPERT